MTNASLHKAIQKKPLKIGLLGGTFDPIHKGHIEPAKHVFTQFHLDKILVIPAHKPPHKNTTQAATEHRVNMAEIVCNNETCFTLDTREINRTSISYTIDTLKEINIEFPNSELFFIMGMDSLLSFTRWHLWQNILKRCHLVVNTRPGYNLLSLNTETKALLNQHYISVPDYQKKIDEYLGDKNSGSVIKKAGYIFLHNAELVSISSTEIRNNLASEHLQNQLLNKNQSEPMSEFQDNLTKEVFDYIKKNQLYVP